MFSCSRTPPKSDMDYGIFNVRRTLFLQVVRAFCGWLPGGCSCLTPRTPVRESQKQKGTSSSTALGIILTRYQRPHAIRDQVLFTFTVQKYIYPSVSICMRMLMTVIYIIPSQKLGGFFIIEVPADNHLLQCVGLGQMLPSLVDDS